MKRGTISMTNGAARAGWGRGGPGSDAPEGAPLHDLVVTIINYGTAEMTIRCLDGVLDAIRDLNAHVALVDNFSDDDSVAVLRAHIQARGPDAPVTLIASSDNSGFSGGHNIGIRAARGRFYLIFNSDAELRPGAPQALLACAAAHPRAGLIGSRLEYEDGTVQGSCFRRPSAWSELDRGACTGPVTKLLRRHVVALPVPPDPAKIEWVSFASVLARAEMIEDIGMMDEGFFLYSEDTEYCWRADRAGWATLYEPAACAVHHRGGSSEVKSQLAVGKRAPAYFYASRARLVATMHGRVGLIAANLAWHLGRAIARLRTRPGRTPPKTVEGEARDIWINAFDPWGDRRRPGGG
jgi:hypothetical protein